MTDTFYDRLGVSPDASREDIERAYRRRVKEYHPDTSDHPNARDRFVSLTRAKDVLTDPKERARYDRLGHATYIGRRAGGSWGASTESRSDAGSGDDGGATSRQRHRESERRSRQRRDSREDSSESGGSDDSGSREDANSETAGAETGSRTAHGQRSGNAGPWGERAPGWTETTATTEEDDSAALFALREAVAVALMVAIAAGGVGAFVVLPVPPGLAAVALTAMWVGAAGVAAWQASRLTEHLPNDVVRAHAVPVVVLVVAWYVHLYAGLPVVVTVLLAGYGATIALFRTATLVAADGGRILPAFGWFVGSLPALLLGYAALAAPQLLRELLGAAAAGLPAIIGGLVLSVGSPEIAIAGGVGAAVAVTLAHALWRLLASGF